MDHYTAIKHKETLKKADMRMDIEGHIWSSFLTRIPGGFIIDKTSTSCHDGVSTVLMSQIKSIKKWKSPDNSVGMAALLRKGTSSAYARLRELRDASDITPEGRHLCGELAMQSKEFCTDLISDITALYDSIIEESHYCGADAWTMCVHALSKVVEELWEARSVFADAGQNEPAYLLWGMLRAWQVQQRYKQKNFKDDPALNGVFVRRLLFKPAVDKVAGEKLAAMEQAVRKIPGLESKIVSVEGKHKVLDEKVRSLPADVRKLAARVDKVERSN